MPTFKETEQAGWTEKAGAYDGYFASISAQAIQPALDQIGDLAGLRLLDLCCGTGDLAAVAAKRGAKVTGVDFAPTMIAIASDKVPAVEFVVGDAHSPEAREAIKKQIVDKSDALAANGTIAMRWPYALVSAVT